VPGQGKHYCVSCARYFIGRDALATHQRSKPHKRRLKELLSLKQQGKKPHSQADAERAAGMGAPDNGRESPKRAAVPMLE
jgi:bud site selection protein 20